MPTYTLVCASCNTSREEFLKPSELDAQVCPVCGSKVRPAPVAAVLAFRGKGWYVTDYGGKKP